MGKRALLTGGTGFVGANLARRLLRDGLETHLLVRRSHTPWRLDEIRSDVYLHELDIGDRQALRNVVAAIEPDCVYHLAAYGAYSSQTGIDRMVATNLLGAIALLDVCCEVGVRAFVSAGSSSEYGYQAHPTRESDLLQPNSHYAVTKAGATHYCSLMARERDIHAVTVRLYSIYGPYEDPTRLIPTLLIQGLKGKLPPLVSPETARDFVYVDDAIDAMIRIAACTDLPRGSIYNVCSGHQTAIRTVVELVKAKLGIEVEPAYSSMNRRPWDTQVWVGSPDAIARDVGWHASISLEAGIEETLSWFRRDVRRVEFYAERLSAV